MLRPDNVCQAGQGTQGCYGSGCYREQGVGPVESGMHRLGDQVATMCQWHVSIGSTSGLYTRRLHVYALQMAYLAEHGQL